MVTTTAFNKLILTFPETEEHPHFVKLAYKVRKKIFATLDEKAKVANLKLTENDQSAFTAFDPTIFYPVPNKWGKQGWTVVELSKVKKEMLLDALTVAYCTVAPAKLADVVSRKGAD